MNLLSIDIDYIVSGDDFTQVLDLYSHNLSRKPNMEVKFSQYHVDIIDLFKDEYGEMSILNIDMHHDIIYNDICDPAEIRNGSVDSTNWLGWTCAHRRVKKYTWCKNNFSDDFDSELMQAFQTLYIKGKTYDVVDSRNIIFSSKKAVTERINENYLKFRPTIEVENKIQPHFYDIDFDKIFVCLSPDYTVKENYFYYDCLKKLYTHFSKK